MPENSIQSNPPPMPAGNASVSGFVTLSHFGLVRVTGEDARAFLHGQLSCDVNALQTARAIYGSYNTPKGRMLASFLLWRDDTGYMLQLPRSLCEPTRKRLSMYVLRSKVKLIDASDDYAMLGLVGTAAVARISAMLGAMPQNALAMSMAPNVAVLRLDADRVQVIARRECYEEIHAGLAGHVPAISSDEWDCTNIQAGIPYILPPTQDQFVPQMANLDLIDAISFTKGCYPGQEIVARMHYLGKLKQRMYLATIDGADVPQPGDKLYSPGTGGQSTGMIVNAAPNGRGIYAVLAVMHIESFEGGDVRLKSTSGPPLQFQKLPYAVPD